MRTTLALAVGLLCLAPQVAQAHGLFAQARLDGDMIVLEVYFSSGAHAGGAEVTVSVDGIDVATGKTDAAGIYLYRPMSYGLHEFSVIEPGLHHARAELRYGPPPSIVPDGLTAEGTVAAPDSASVAHSHSGVVALPHDHAYDDDDRAPDPIGAVPWPRIALGLLVIAGLALVLRAVQAKPDDPWLGERDDRARMLTLVAVVCGAGAVNTLAGALIALSLGVLTALSLGMKPAALTRRVLPLLALLVPLFVLTPFWHRPTDSSLLVSAWTWGPTDAGLLEALRVAARVLAIGLLAVAALDPVPFDRTIKALQDLRVPRALTHTALLTYRYLFLFQSDLRRVRHALASRGFRPRVSVATANTFGAVTGGLLVRSLARTERVEQAMRCRGYTGALITTRPRAVGGADGLLVLTAVAVACALVIVDRAGLGWLQ